MKLNIGSGTTRYENFLNCDYDNNCKPDYQFDMEHDSWPFADNTVDQVIAHHVLEHMGEGYFHVIKELYRICKHGAVIDIKVPHHRHNHFANDPTHRRAITPDGLWLFSKKYNDSCIKQNVAASRLGYYYDVNFEVMDVVNVPDTDYIKLFEGKPVVEIERYIHEHNNIIVEVGIKLVVLKEND